MYQKCSNRLSFCLKIFKIKIMTGWIKVDRTDSYILQDISKTIKKWVVFTATVVKLTVYILENRK